MLIRVRWAASAEQGEAITRMFSYPKSCNSSPGSGSALATPPPPTPLTCLPDFPLLSSALSSSLLQRFLKLLLQLELLR